MWPRRLALRSWVAWIIVGCFALCSNAQEIMPGIAGFPYFGTRFNIDSHKDRRSVESNTVVTTGQKLNVTDVHGIADHLQKVGIDALHSGRANRNVREVSSTGTRIKMDFPPEYGGGSESSQGRGAKEVIPRIDFQERAEPPTAKPGKGAGVHQGRGVKVEIPRIDFQERAEPPTAKPGKGRGVNQGGRGAKEVIPRIDFEERAEPSAGNTKKGKGVDVIQGRGAKEVFPRIDFQERAEPSAATPGKGRGVDTKAGRGVKEVIPRIDFQERAEPPTAKPGKGRGVNKMTGSGAKEEVPRIDFQQREETPPKPGTKGNGPQAGRGVQAVAIKSTETPPAGLGGATKIPHVSDGFDGKITIVMKNSKIVDISIAPELLMKLVDGSFKMTSTKEGNEPIFAIDVAKEGHDKAHYKLPGLRISANRAIGGSADDERVQEGRPIVPKDSDLDFEPERLPAMVVVRNKQGEEPIFYGKIEEHEGHKVMTPLSPEEVKSSDSTVYELIRTKAVSTSGDSNSTLPKSK